MKSTKRALRRHHRQRMIARAHRSGILRCGEDDESYRQRALRRYDNLKKCSCWMCGNPRRYEGQATRQERRLFEAHRCDGASPLTSDDGRATRG